MSKSTFLEEILMRRRLQVAKDRAAGDPRALRREAEHVRERRVPHRLRAALRKHHGVNIIGEFKRSSPSLGMIRNDADPAQMAALYEKSGVCAISVLTEPEFFHGSLEDLRQVRASTELPVLQKDFVVDEYQIVEAAASGADAILLIVAALSDDDLLRLRRFAEETLGLDALVEVHTAEEMRRATRAGATLIGVNNRDLRTFATSIDTSVRLATLAPPSATLVSESGITSPAQIQKLKQCGYHGFLVGESLMRAANPAELIDSLRNPEFRKAQNA